MGTPSPVTVHSPHGEWRVCQGLWVQAWTSEAARESQFVYFWAVSSRPVSPPMEYRVLQNGTEVVGWQPTAASAAVFAKTGVVDDEEDPDYENLVGGAERLPAGTFDFEFRVTVDDKIYVLTGVRFLVANRGAGRAGRPRRPPPNRSTTS